MKVQFSKEFVKATGKLSGKYKKSVLEVIEEVREASSVPDITDCTKLVGYTNVYRIRVGSLRIIFLLEILDEETVICYFSTFSKPE